MATSEESTLNDERAHTPRGRRLELDPTAIPAREGEPAFLARPEDAPIYHGFPLVEATRTDGWCYGAITEHLDPDGCEDGDGFVEAPDGSRAGLAWSVGAYPIRRIVKPTPDRWGVYAVAFPEPIRTEADLVAAFRQVLPELQSIHAEAGRRPPRRWWWPFG